jgi:hypothetical protein
MLIASGPVTDFRGEHSPNKDGCYGLLLNGGRGIPI